MFAFARLPEATFGGALAPIVALISLLSASAAFAAVPGDAAKTKEEAEAREEEPEQPAFQVDWYGFIKLDSSWDESLIESGNFARWVASPAVVEDHSHFNMTARQSRLGVNLNHKTRNAPPIQAKIEIDFYGGGAENKNRPQLRHAYFDINWPQRGWLLRAGQTSDVISPLAPTTLNYTVAWWAGNIGYRRPMARLTRTVTSESGKESRLTMAISRTIGDDFGALEPGDSGVDSGVPTFQASASHSWRAAGGRRAKVGVSGHWGQERLEETLGQPAPEFDSWSANVDLQVPVAEKGTFKAEAWSGINLDDYFGGIGQGIHFAEATEIEAAGGWLAYESRIGSGTLVSLGYGLDDPKDETLPVGARSRNQAAWANLLWDFRPALRFGVEGSWWKTAYLGGDEASSLRLQGSLIYTFSN